MIIKGSWKHTASGRKLRTETTMHKKPKEEFKSHAKPKKEFKPYLRPVIANDRYKEWEEKVKSIPSAGFKYTGMAPVEDKSYQLEISKKFTVSIPYNKGAYQVIPDSDIDKIGK